MSSFRPTPRSPPLAGEGKLSAAARVAVLAWFACVALPSVSRAQMRPRPVSPGSVFMDKIEADSVVTLDSSINFYDADSGTDTTGWLTTLHGQYLAPFGAAGYLTLPMGFGFSSSDALGTETDAIIGNLELGGAAISKRKTRVILGRAGIVLPTARISDSAPDIGYRANRLSDVTNNVLLRPEHTYLRLSGSYIVRSGGVFFRTDFGLDIPFDTTPGATDDPLFRLNLSAGANLRQAAVGFELVTTGATSDTDFDSGERVLHEVGVFVRVRAPYADPVIALGLPIDDGVRDIAHAYLLFGADVPLPL